MICHRSFGSLVLGWIGLAILASLAEVGHAGEGPEASSVAEGRRWGVIVQGLPGDAEHARQFRTVCDQLRTWLVESLEFPREQVVSLPETAEIAAEQTPALTAEEIRSTLVDLAAKLHPADTLWVFTVGHGSHDGRRAWFHVAGPDPSDVDLADWLAEVRCREQVLWLTHSSSGWLVKSLARPGRIVIAATAADDEPNETEFPHALMAVLREPPAKLDRNGDGQLSLAELFSATVQQVARRFQRDQRVPTEHAQLDDTGDGVGSETLVDPTHNAPATENPQRQDGKLSHTVFVPDRRLRPSSPEAPP
jgi:hypothetical protein